MRLGGLVFAAALAMLVTGCTQSCSQGPPAPSGGKTAQNAEVKASAGVAQGEQATDETYASALRKRDYKLAAKLLDQATASDQKEPEVRYARALVALELDDLDTALRKIDDFEETAPDFSPEAKALRIEAARRSGDVTLLTHFLGDARRRSSLTSLEERLVLAEAHRSSSSLKEALALTDEVLKILQKAKKPSTKEKRVEAKTRLLRAELLANLDDEKGAAREYRWLANQGKTYPEALDADDKAEQFDPSRPLTAAQRLARADAFSKEGWLDRTDDELRRLDASPGDKPPQAKRDAVLAWAVYISRSDYDRAAKLFASAAKADGDQRKKHLYYEARSLARAHRNDEAIAKYSKLSALGGPYGEHASYQAPRLHYISGHWQEALTGYEAYLARFKSGSHRDSVIYELAITRLAAGQYQEARKALAALVKRADSSRERARLLELEAVAAEGQNKLDIAEALYRKVIIERPLSLPALLAEVRLLRLGLTPPPVLLPPPAQNAQPPLAVELPEKAWRLSRVGLDEHAESTLRQNERSLRKQYAPRESEALCRLYGQLASGRRRYQIAQTAARWSTLKYEPLGNALWQWECIYPKPYADSVAHEAKTRRVPQSLVYAVMRQESAFRPAVVSPAKAVGLMQIIPPTAARIAEEIHEEYEPEAMTAPPVNIRFGTYYLRRLLDIFDGRAELVAASYNAGPMAVSRWLEGGEELPLDVFVARIPYKETRNYVYRVMGNYARYAYLSGKEDMPLIALTIPKGIRAPNDAY